MSDTQLSIFPLLDRSKITLELKPYIQPFERVLARAELIGLTGDILNDNFSFSKVADEYLTIEPNVDIEFLRRRITYWQRIGKKHLKPTLQVEYEISEKEQDDLTISKSRLLRYGLHDLHNYRGKFFPQLVRALINFTGVPQDAIILDPTCGSGTTNCEARVLGMKTIGLDLNPLSVSISQAKSAMLDLEPDILEENSERLLNSIHSALPDYKQRWETEDLKYLKRWFDLTALSEISQILVAIETQNNFNSTIRNFFKICLSNIIREISWQKEQDLRVRKEIYNYQQGIALQRFEQEVIRQISKIVPYLRIHQSSSTADQNDEWKIFEGDARNLNQIIPQYTEKCDVLITSPPYATALPYLDTDRLSLVILGLLKRKDYRQREKKLIGNREITDKERYLLWSTYQQRRKELPKNVCNLIDEIAIKNHSDNVGFRRRNLPALLAKYYLDMTDAMSQSRKMMKPNSYGFYVVGNNSTTVEESRINIPTDEFLWEIGERAGWYQVETLKMELLPSRDVFRRNSGSAETLLIFRSTIHRKAIYSYFKEQTQTHRTEDWNFKNAKTQEHLHALHPYPARFIPQIANKALKLYSDRGDTVLDPFSGCGTTALESVLLGRKAIGIDNNPVAHLIASAKVKHYTRDDIKCLRDFFYNSDSSLLNIPKDIWQPEYKNMTSWFSENAILDLSKLKWLIEKLPEQPRLFGLAVFSSIIVRSSKQDSDTRYARIERKYQNGDAIKLFKSRLADLIDRLDEIIDLPKSEANLHLHDSRNLSFIATQSINLIVTSPPYLNAYDYHKYHRHRIHWIEGSVEMARDLEIGKHDTFTRPNANPELYFEDMRICFSEWKRVLKKGARAFVVIGDSIVNKKPVRVADRFTEIMCDLGFELENHWLRKVKTSKKSFNSHARINEEHILLYRLLL